MLRHLVAVLPHALFPCVEVDFWLYGSNFSQKMSCCYILNLGLMYPAVTRLDTNNCKQGKFAGEITKLTDKYQTMCIRTFFCSRTLSMIRTSASGEKTEILVSSNVNCCSIAAKFKLRWSEVSKFPWKTFCPLRVLSENLRIPMGSGCAQLVMAFQMIIAGSIAPAFTTQSQRPF